MISAYYDRREEDKAVLLLGDDMDKVILPAKYLPKKASEGDYLKLDISIDEETTQSAEDEAIDLLNKLKQKSGKE